MREIDGGVYGWEKEGDWKRKRERRGSETDVFVSYNEYELSVKDRHCKLDTLYLHIALLRSIVLSDLQDH